MYFLGTFDFFMFQFLPVYLFMFWFFITIPLGTYIANAKGRNALLWFLLILAVGFVGSGIAFFGSSDKTIILTDIFGEAIKFPIVNWVFDMIGAMIAMTPFAFILIASDNKSP